MSALIPDLRGRAVLPGTSMQNDSVRNVRKKTPDRKKKMSQAASPAHRPLRVCMITYTFYETDSRVMRYAEALTQRGDRVDVFALRGPGTSRTETLSGVQVHRLQGRSFRETGRFSYSWRILAFLLQTLVRVAAHDLRHRYDLVHVHSVPDFLVLSALLPRLRGTPIILDIRDILPEFYSSKFGVAGNSLGFRLLCMVERLSVRFSDHVIVANHRWRERLVSRSAKRADCSVMLNVPDRSIFTRRANNSGNGSRFLLLYHGTLNPHQGLDVAIRAFAKIKDLAPEADFHIYGDGPSKPELIALAQRLGLKDRVRLHRRKPLREIAAVVETAHLGIVPKRKDAFGDEAFSTKTLEFMAMGVPVIISDTKIDRYYLKDSVVCFFKGEDEDDLAERMLELIRDREKRAALAAQATKFVANYDWAVQKQQYFDLLDSLVPDPGLVN